MNAEVLDYDEWVPPHKYTGKKEGTEQETKISYGDMSQLGISWLREASRKIKRARPSIGEEEFLEFFRFVPISNKEVFINTYYSRDYKPITEQQMERSKRRLVFDRLDEVLGIVN